MKYKNFESMPMVIFVSDIADTLEIGRNNAYDLVKTGKIKAFKIGNQYRISRDEFVAFLTKPITCA